MAVHASGAVRFAGEVEAKVPPNGLLTIAATRRGGRWQLISFSNTPTGPGRNVKFLWRFIVSRLATRRAGRQGTAVHAGGQATEYGAMDRDRQEGMGAPMFNMIEVRRFRVDVAEEDLVELRRRVAATRWPDRAPPCRRYR